ncbi:MAG: hypothetical protein ABSH41_23925 [Syntrophobacteraceae bacterium]|jgi:hypothetical protein
MEKTISILKRGGAMKERFKRPGLWSVMICLLVLIGGVTSQAAAQMSQMKMAPGMPFIANSAINAPLLEEILTGQIPATIPQYTTLPDPTGQIKTYNHAGPTQTAANGFFIPTPRLTSAPVLHATSRRMTGR